MATTSKWTAPEAIASALTTELNALANGSISAASSAIDNETGLYLYMSVELALATLTPTGTPYCNLYLVKSVDGTNFEDLNVSMGHEVIAVFPMATTAAAKRIAVANILIPPLQFKLAVENQTGVSLAASGSTLKYRRHYEQQV
jgi:hypothetical protein